MPKKVFLSYRRDDTAAAAGRVYDRLSQLLSKANVFFDVNAISGGEDFERKIASEIGRSDVVLIFIGNRWLEPAPATGQSRIWEPGDFVRAEVRAALARPILVLPILVAGARMPARDELPDDIKAMASQNALPLRHDSFDDDSENIVAAVLGEPARTRPWEAKGGRWSKIGCVIVGAIVSCILMLVGVLIHNFALARPLAASIGAPLTELMLIATPILGGWVGWRYEVWKRGSR